MKKTLLFVSCLMASIGAWAYGSTDCYKYITSQSDVATQLGNKNDTISTSTKHMTVLVRVAAGDTIVIDGYKFKNTNPEDVNGGTKNWSVIGVENSTGSGLGVVILRNCTVLNTQGGAGVQSYEKAKVILENCNITTSRYRTAGYGGYASTCVQVQAGKVDVMSGTYTSAGAALLITTSGGEMNVYGGTFTTTNKTAPFAYSSTSADNNYTGAVFCDKSGIMNLRGGVFYGDIFDRNENGSKVTIYGGKFLAKEIIGNSKTTATHVADFPASTIKFDGWRYVGYGDEYQYKRASGTIYDEFETDKVKTPSRAISNVSYSTACFDRKPTSSNVKFYQPVAIIDTLVYIKDVALSELEAGMPYLYKNEGSDSAYFTFQASETPVALSENNGLVGTIDGINYNVWKQRPISEYTDTLVGKYLLVANEWKLNSENGAYVLPNCAYINYESTKPTLVMTTAEVPTACAKVSATNAQDGKVILNGKVYIRRNGQLFSVLGNAVE